jgi:hypothetical protein
MLLDKLSPGLSEEQKMSALQSLAKEVLHLASDTTLEITLIPPLSAEKQKAAETPPAVSTQVTETIAGTSTTHAEEKVT